MSHIPKNRLYWLIFDTCAEPTYYRDVHNVLALPAGAVIRYNYSDYLLSPTALSAARHWKDAPWIDKCDRVLLVYAQVKGFTRGNDLEEAVRNALDLLWVPTRYGKLIDLSVKNDKYYFDIMLDGHPTLPKIEAPLLSDLTQEHPLQKDKAKRAWVTISASDTPARLREEEASSDNWHTIVRWFQQHSQFSSDSFWRIESAMDGPRAHLAQPTPSGTTEFDQHGVALGYELLQREQLALSIENYEAGTGDVAAEHRGRKGERYIGIECDSDLVRISPENPILRPYYVRTVRLRAGAEALLQDAYHHVRLATNQQSDDWPVGAAFTVTLKVRRSRRELLLGALAGVFGVCALFWADKYPGANAAADTLAWSLLVVALGVSLLSASSYLLYRQLAFKS